MEWGVYIQRGIYAMGAVFAECFSVESGVCIEWDVYIQRGIYAKRAVYAECMSVE
jgi:hypothetical protein